MNTQNVTPINPTPLSKDFTVDKSTGEAFISQRKLAQLCGVNQSTISRHFSASPNSQAHSGIGEKLAFKCIASHAEKGKPDAIKSLILIGSAGMKEIELKHDLFGNIRTFKDGSDYYFVGIDVARALGYKNEYNAIARHCTFDDDHRAKRGAMPLKDSSGRIREHQLIREPDLYRLAIRSKLAGAVKFEKWVFEDVLPCIRKFGCYPEPEVKRVKCPGRPLRSSDRHEAVTASQLLEENEYQTHVIEFFRVCAEMDVTSRHSTTKNYNQLENKYFGYNEKESNVVQPVFFRENFAELMDYLGLV